MPAKKAGQRVLRITFQIDDARGHLNDYQVVPLQTDNEVALAAWRFRKRGMVDGQVLEEYDVKLDQYGLSCDCMGHERHGYCKHADAVARMLGRIYQGPKKTTTG